MGKSWSSPEEWRKRTRGARSGAESVAQVELCGPTDTMWQAIGGYEYECAFAYDAHSNFVRSYYTGWHRCVGGRLADGRWPQWNSKTGEKRFA